MHTKHSPDWQVLAANIKEWGKELGFAAVGIASAGDLGTAESGLLAWLEAGFHGEMDYMARHGVKRARPNELVSGSVTIISVQLNYWPAAADATETLADAEYAYISRYAMGRDYHKLLRARLKKLAGRIEAEIGERGGAFLDNPAGKFVHRVFADSAPVLEVELAARSGIGWRGKHTLLLSRAAGSMFFLGEIYCMLPLPPDTPASDHCGTCNACIAVCPTNAIVAPYRLDARRCISYLTIELKGSIPLDLRPLIGNRVYGCDDCQLHCPWNRNAPHTREDDFAVRHGLDHARLSDLFRWSAADFKERMAGSAIYRIGHERWLRNLAVGLGNAPSTPEVIAALRSRREDSSALVREHVAWALGRHGQQPAIPR